MSPLFPRDEIPRRLSNGDEKNRGHEFHPTVCVDRAIAFLQHIRSREPGSDTRPFRTSFPHRLSDPDGGGLRRAVAAAIPHASVSGHVDFGNAPADVSAFYRVLFWTSDIESGFSFHLFWHAPLPRESDCHHCRSGHRVDRRRRDLSSVPIDSFRVRGSACALSWP